MSLGSGAEPSFLDMGLAFFFTGSKEKGAKPIYFFSLGRATVYLVAVLCHGDFCMLYHISVTD